MKFKEELLQFIWQYKLFVNRALRSVRGETLEIIDTGKLNLNAGADFIHAKVKIGDTLLAGNVEIHVRERDWIAHKHNEDKAYDNIILHVVYIADNSVKRNFETLELKPLIDQKLLHTYQMLFDNRVKIPCFYIFRKPDPMELSMWLHTLAIGRLEKKIYAINELFLQQNSDWNRTTAILVAGFLGGQLNKEPLMQLMQSFDYRILAKYCKNIFKMEALLFGQAGMLEETAVLDEYHGRLAAEYRHIKSLYQLTPLQLTAWKFSRLRPAAFPTIRIAQLAQLLFVHQHLFDDLVKNFDLETVYHILSNETSDYWKTHYHFGSKKLIEKKKSIGRNSMDIVIINAIVPLLFYYGKEIDNQDYCDRSLQILEMIEAEENSITRLWASLDLQSSTAFESQALIQLKTNYCDRFHCLKCRIGLCLMKQSTS